MPNKSYYWIDQAISISVSEHCFCNLVGSIVGKVLFQGWYEIAGGHTTFCTCLWKLKKISIKSVQLHECLRQPVKIDKKDRTEYVTPWCALFHNFQNKMKFYSFHLAHWKQIRMAMINIMCRISWAYQSSIRRKIASWPSPLLLPLTSLALSLVCYDHLDVIKTF